MSDRWELGRARRAGFAAARFARWNPRVNLVDVGWKLRAGRPTGDLAVRVHVRDKPTGDAFEHLARHRPDLVVDTDRIPYRTDVIEAAYRFEHDLTTAGVTQWRQMHRPLVGGVSVGNAWSARYGTLGGVVLSAATGQPRVLSNWHVLVGSSLARPGLAVYQPAAADAWYGRSTIGVLAVNALDTGYDAALAALSPHIGWRNEQLGIGVVTGAAVPALGSQVRKSGRGSGITAGVVDGIDGTFTFPYGGLQRTIRDVCRVVAVGPADRVSRSGDSGSWWLNPEQRAVGLHFAGQAAPSVALAMAMPAVLAALSVTLPQQSHQ